MPTFMKTFDARIMMKCGYNDKYEGHYADTEAGLFLTPEKHAKLDVQRFSLWRDVTAGHESIGPK
jgi:hypothetical protein